MPWTFAHPAAVLPLLRFTKRGRLSFAALAVGSMSPDFGYYLGRFEMAQFAHTPLGVLVACLPLGVVVYCLAVRLRGPVAQMLPLPHRHALTANSLGSPSLDLRWLSVVAMSLVIGAVTHVLWDAFTHEGRFFVQHIDWLREPLFTAFDREFRTFNVLQHASTFVGIACLGLSYFRYARRFGPFDVLCAADRRRWAVLAAIAVAALLIAVPFALADATGTAARTNLSKLFVREIIYASTVFLVLLAGAALWSQRRHRVRGC